MKIKDITVVLEEFAPLELQENYDNSGLIIGTQDQEITGILISVDITEAVIDEAIQRKANLIIAHHPILFNGIKKITGKNYIERCILKSIKHNIALYCAHTNFDNINNGVSYSMCQKLGLTNLSVLEPLTNNLIKLAVFVPEKEAEKVRMAMFSAGAGNIGNYDQCSYNFNGNGTFRANEIANPYVGQKNKLHIEPETCIQVVLPRFKVQAVLNAMKSVHPYEEPAFDLYPIENKWDTAGAGMIGFVNEEIPELDFLIQLKKIFNLKTIRHSPFTGKKIKKVAVCGGSGSSLLKTAIQKGANAYVTADFKYHQFFDADNKLIIADIGHYESEQFVKEILFDLIIKKFPNFAVYLSEINTNPINYFL